MDPTLALPQVSQLATLVRGKHSLAVLRQTVKGLLRRLHMLHHFRDPERGFGVSAPWWDYIFKTAHVAGERDYRFVEAPAMGLSVGIVGLPNVGKSTIFNALTAAGAQSANYPFCTIEPNVGIVPVVDQRLNTILGSVMNATYCLQDRLRLTYSHRERVHTGRARLVPHVRHRPNSCAASSASTRPCRA